VIIILKRDIVKPSEMLVKRNSLDWCPAMLKIVPIIHMQAKKPAFM